MLIISFLTGLAMLIFARQMDLSHALLAEGFGAILGTAVELLSPSEWDTATVPAVIAVVLLILR